MATNFNDTTPAAVGAGVNVKWQADGSNNVSAYVPGPGVGLIDTIDIVIQGIGASGSPAISNNIYTGVAGYIQIPWACTIVGWSIIAKESSGSISVDIDAHASSAPPTAPTLPNTTSDKISASAPVALSSAQSAAVGTAGVSTWTTARAAYDVIGFNVTSVTGVTRCRISLTVSRTS